MWKLWTMFGIDKNGNDEAKATIPSIKNIQPSVLINRLRQINHSLLQGGDATFYVGGLTEESIKFILDRCIEEGYQVWQEVGLCANKDNPDYRICVKAGDYTQTYCLPIANVPEDAFYKLKPFEKAK